MRRSTQGSTGGRTERSPVGHVGEGPAQEVEDLDDALDPELAEDDDDVLTRPRPTPRRRRGARVVAQAEPREELAPDEEPDPELDEDDDDIVQRRRVRRAEASPQAQRPTMTRGERAVIVLGAVAGIVLAIWFLGGPTTTPTTNPPATQAAQGAQVDRAALAAEIVEATKAVEQSPDDAKARIALGILLINAGDGEAASSQLQTAAKLEPTKAEPWYYLGFSYLASTPADQDAAMKAWDKVLELEPDSDFAKTVSTHIQGLAAEPSSAPSASPSASPAQPSSAADPDSQG